MKNKTKLLISVLLITGIMMIIGSVIINYYIKPKQIYSIDSQNLIEDGSFENFNQTARDCCKLKSEIAKIYAAKSSIAYEGDFSLNLTSENRCACVSFPLTSFDNTNIYLLSFYYKGDNPKFCNWVSGDNKCLPLKSFNATNEWINHKDTLIFSEISKASSVYFYTESRNGKTFTNLYDDLRVHKLIPKDDENFSSSVQYVIKTRADNKVNGERISDIGKDGEAYFLVKGKPIVKIKFPLSEIVIVSILIIIIIYVIFRKKEPAHIGWMNNK